MQDFLAHSQNENAVMLAVQSGNCGVLRELLQDGQKPDAFSSGRITPLMWACRCGNLKQAKLLIKYGADLDLESSEGITSFEYACISKNLSLVRFLLKFNPDINHFNKGDMTPLMTASAQNFSLAACC